MATLTMLSRSSLRVLFSKHIQTCRFGYGSSGIGCTAMVGFRVQMPAEKPPRRAVASSNKDEMLDQGAGSLGNGKKYFLGILPHPAPLVTVTRQCGLRQHPPDVQPPRSSTEQGLSDGRATSTVRALRATDIGARVCFGPCQNPSGAFVASRRRTVCIQQPSLQHTGCAAGQALGAAFQLALLMFFLHTACMHAALSQQQPQPVGGCFQQRCHHQLPARN